VFRYPGATRGYVSLDKDYLVVSLEIFDDIQVIYDLNKLDGFNQFIGRKIEV